MPIGGTVDIKGGCATVRGRGRGLQPLPCRDFHTGWPVGKGRGRAVTSTSCGKRVTVNATDRGAQLCVVLSLRELKNRGACGRTRSA